MKNSLLRQQSQNTAPILAQSEHINKKRKRSEKIETAFKLEENPLKYDPLLSQKEFLTVKEACSLLGASRWTIYRLIENEKLNAAKLGRKTIIKRADIDALF